MPNGFQLHYTVKPTKNNRPNNLRQNKIHQSLKITLYILTLISMITRVVLALAVVVCNEQNKDITNLRYWLMRSLTLLSMITRTRRLAVVVCNEQNKDITNLKYHKKLQESIKLKHGKDDGTSIWKFISIDANWFA